MTTDCESYLLCNRTKKHVRWDEVSPKLRGAVCSFPLHDSKWYSTSILPTAMRFSSAVCAFESNVTTQCYASQ